MSRDGKAASEIRVKETRTPFYHSLRRLFFQRAGVRYEPASLQQRQERILAWMAVRDWGVMVNIVKLIKGREC